MQGQAEKEGSNRRVFAISGNTFSFKNFKRKTRTAPVFDENGVCVKYSLADFTKPIFDDKHRFIIHYGGRAGEKSYADTDALIFLAKSKKTDIVCAREVQNSIKDSTHKLWRTRLKYFGYDDFKVYENRIENLVNGSEIVFRGMNEINDKSTQGLKGLEDFDIVHFDEAQSASKNTLSVLIPTIRKPGSKLIFTLNPLYDDDAIMDFINNPRPRSFIKYLTFADNPYVTDETLEEARNCLEHTPQDFEHIWLGKTRNEVYNSVVKHFSDDNVRDELNYNPNYLLHVTCDFNVATMAWGVSQIIGGVYRFIDEICIENTTTKDTAEEFVRRYGHHQGKVVVNGDSSGKNRSTQSEAHNYGIIQQVLSQTFKDIVFDVARFNPAVDARVVAFNNQVKTLNGDCNILINRTKCPIMLDTMKNLRYTDDGRSIYNPSLRDIQNKPNSKWHPHLFDAISYQTWFYSHVA